MDEKKLIESKQGNIVKYVCLGLVGVGFLSLTIGKLLMRFLFFMFHSEIIFFPMLIISAILFFATARCSMTITDKRVYGKAAFGKRVDLPLDSISAVSTSILNSISVSTSSGKIQFFDIANQDEMYQILSNLLIERQKSKSNEPIIKQEVQQSNADELKKFKDLLDSGVITQEEFDEKKKQLLGL